MVHPDAAVGFAAAAAEYERGRPGYPAAVAHVVAACGIGPGRTVVDLGASTGKFTRLLTATGATVLAVEPVAEMAAVLAEVAPGVRVVGGTAEAIGCDDASVDAVVSATAFHWFDLPRAAAEVARVLRPGGGLGLVWNIRDESVRWVAALSEVLGGSQRQGERYGRRDWATAVEQAAPGLFGPLALHEFLHAQSLDRAAFRDRVASISYVASAAPAERDRLVAGALALVDGFPEPFELPYVTRVWTGSRRC